MTASWLSVARNAATLREDLVASLEASLASDPDDLETHVKLLGYYYFSAPHRKDDWKRHVIWLISNYPEIYLASLTVPGRRYSDLSDEIGNLWNEQLAKHPSSAVIMLRAAQFFESADPSRAVQLAEAGAQLEPSESTWPAFLARLIVGQWGYQEANDIRRRRLSDAVDLFARGVALEKEPAQRLVLLLEMGQAAYKADDIRRAESVASEILSEIELERAGLPSWCVSHCTHYSHILLGLVALTEGGGLERARKELIDASVGQISPAMSSFGPDFALASALLASGCRTDVINYLRWVRTFWTGRQDRLDRWIDAISNGVDPMLTDGR